MPFVATKISNLSRLSDCIAAEAVIDTGCLSDDPMFDSHQTMRASVDQRAPWGPPGRNRAVWRGASLDGRVDREAVDSLTGSARAHRDAPRASTVDFGKFDA